MTLYRVCDSTIGSNVPLPELPESSGNPEWTFELLERPSLGQLFGQPLFGQQGAAPEFEWFHQWDLPDGRVWLHIGRQGSSYVLRFPDIADFLITGDARTVRCYPSPRTPLESIRHLLLDQVLPLILGGPGRLILHASAVATPKGAVAFLAPTGYGKSTLAAFFSQSGIPMMTDDCLLIEERSGELFAVPSYPGLRLWPETVSELFGNAPETSHMAHYSTKKRVGAAQAGFHYQSERSPLSRIYLLGTPGEHRGAPEITSLPPREAFIEMVRFAFLMDISDPATLTAKFRTVSRAAALPIFRRLQFTREFSLLPAVRDAISLDLSAS